MMSPRGTPKISQGPRDRDKLTAQQKRFIQEYAIDLNGTQAAIRAGYSRKTARSIASENLKRQGVKKAIQQALRTDNERLKGLTAIAFADATGGIRKDPKLGIVVDQNSPSVKSVRRFTRFDPNTGLTHEVLSIKFVDRARALHQLGRRLGAW